MSTYLPDDNPAINQKNYLLDPLSVIVKLAILANKPVGTKVCIQNNVMTFQDPGIFQGFCRTMYNLNKTDLHYMYNPIQLACLHFLSSSAVKSRPRMRNLFTYAQKGLERLMDTYRANSTIRHSLNYYYAIIGFAIERCKNTPTGWISPKVPVEGEGSDAKYNTMLFRKDGMSVLYGDELVASLNGQWTDKWIKAVLDMNGFLSDDSISPENIRILESLMMTIDSQTKALFLDGSFPTVCAADKIDKLDTDLGSNA
jgi:hypothetical protein